MGASALGILKRPEARGGMLAVALLFAGQFTLFTYLRPFLEGTTGLSVSQLSLVLLRDGRCRAGRHDPDWPHDQAEPGGDADGSPRS